VIFYQNMPNLHNRYKSVERKIVWWSRLPTKMTAKLKIEKRGDEILIVHCWFKVHKKCCNIC
jgi:hypothetical protein